MRLIRSSCCLLVLLGCACGAWGDTITLTNGDTLRGRVVEQDAEQVVIDHEVLGQMTIARDRVSDIVVAQGIEAGAERESTPTAPSDEEVTAAQTLLTGQGYTVEPPAGEEPLNPGLKIGSLTFLEGWERRFELGFNGAEGNTRNFNIRAALSGFYEDAETRWFADAVYSRQSSNRETTEASFYTAITRDWLLPGKRHFYFMTGRYDWDQFQDWDHRASGAAGIGYNFIKEEDFELLGRAGLGGNRTWGGEDDSFTPEGLLGVEMRWNITEGQVLAFSHTYYPDLEDVDESRNLTKAEWRIRLSTVENLSLKLGAENEYQSAPGGDAKHNDFRYYGALVLDF